MDEIGQDWYVHLARCPSRTSERQFRFLGVKLQVWYTHATTDHVLFMELIPAFRLEGDDSIFKEGHQFQPMTYTYLCKLVAFESCELGGPPLRPKRRLDSSGIIDYVDFYCPHGRQFPPRTKVRRTSRTNEDTRVRFSGCNFSFRVRRDPKVIPVVVVDDDKKASSESHQDSTGIGNETSASNPDSKLDSSVIYGWFIDSTKRQEEDGRYRKECHTWEHFGHLRHGHSTADVAEMEHSRKRKSSRRQEYYVNAAQALFNLSVAN